MEKIIVLKCKAFAVNTNNSENIFDLAHKIEEFLKENNIKEIKSCTHTFNGNSRLCTALLIYEEN